MTLFVSLGVWSPVVKEHERDLDDENPNPMMPTLRKYSGVGGRVNAACTATRA
jgi:hypothetical protein